MVLSREVLWAFLQTAYGLDPQMGDEVGLFSTGVLDSHGMIDLLGFLEEQTGVRPTWAEVNLKNLDSVLRILAFAERLRARG